MEKQSHADEFIDGRFVNIERKLYLYRKLAKLSVLGKHTSTYVTIRKIQESGDSIDGYHGIGATVRQISLVHHHAFTQIGPAIFPIVVHCDQNIREYPTTDHLSMSLGTLGDDQASRSTKRSLILPAIKPEAEQLQYRQGVIQSESQTVHQLGQIAEIEVRVDVGVLKILHRNEGYHVKKPAKRPV